MMTEKKITFDQLVPELVKTVASLNKEYQERANEIIKSTAKKINSEIKKTTAFKDGKKSSNHLKKSFVVVSSSSNIDTVKNYYVTAKKNKKWRLVHLIENGHRMINHDGSVSKTRSFVAGRPFLQPLVDIYSPMMISEIKKMIQTAKGS